MQGFQRPITVTSALRSIKDRSYLLPAIQRRFVWSSEKVEALFDSLMRGYRAAQAERGEREAEAAKAKGKGPRAR